MDNDLAVYGFSLLRYSLSMLLHYVIHNHLRVFLFHRYQWRSLKTVFVWHFNVTTMALYELCNRRRAFACVPSYISILCLSLDTLKRHIRIHILLVSSSSHASPLASISQARIYSHSPRIPNQNTKRVKTHEYQQQH